MILKTQRLLLRPVQLADAPRFVESRNDPRIAVPGGMATTETLSQARRILRKTRTEMRKRVPSRLAFSIILRRGGDWIGTISLRWSHKGLGDLGYYLKSDYWGMGYATEAVRRVITLAFRDFGAHRVQATTWVKNHASARVLRKSGLRKEGRLRGYLARPGEVRDEFIFGITRPDWKTRN